MKALALSMLLLGTAAVASDSGPVSPAEPIQFACTFEKLSLDQIGGTIPPVEKVPFVITGIPATTYGANLMEYVVNVFVCNTKVVGEIDYTIENRRGEHLARGSFHATSPYFFHEVKVETAAGARETSVFFQCHRK